MLKSFILLCRTMVPLILFLSVGVNAFAWGEVKKAKEYMASEMYPQAIALLEKRIAEKPNDAEAYFQLGICHINQQNYPASVP